MVKKNRSKVLFKGTCLSMKNVKELTVIEM